MAKKFNFKLQGVLRLKELREQEIKNQLGKLLKDINKLQEKVVQLREEIRFYFSEYEKNEKNKSSNLLQGLRAYMPDFLTSHYQKIRDCQKQILDLEKMKSEHIINLNKAKGDVKIFSEMKDKKYEEFKFQENKKLEQELEEIFISKRNVE